MTRKPLLFAAIAALAGLSIVARTRTVVLEDTFLPPNDLKISVDSLDAKGITQKQFNDVMDSIQAIYGPIVASRGGKLVINRLWSDGTVNASAQRSGKNYILNMYGGLARHEAITQDGMALVACHEMGHHIGGAPKYGGGSDWASNEGQADYFANLKCLRRVFADGKASVFTRPLGDDPGPRQACAKAFTEQVDRELCERGAMAGMSVTKLFKALGRVPVAPRFDTPDPKVVSKMYDGHPEAQCRLDTYFQGSLCARPVGQDVDERNPAVGTCTRSGGFNLGLRPLCWYKAPAGEPSGRQLPVLVAHAPTPKLMSALSQTELWKGL